MVRVAVTGDCGLFSFWRFGNRVCGLAPRIERVDEFFLPRVLAQPGHLAVGDIADSTNNGQLALAKLRPHRVAETDQIEDALSDVLADSRGRDVCICGLWVGLAGACNRGLDVLQQSGDVRRDFVAFWVSAC